MPAGGIEASDEGQPALRSLSASLRTNPFASGLAGFSAGHLLSLAILYLGWRWQRLMPGQPEFAMGTWKQFLSSWDGEWYFEIATNGYPSSLPVDADGVVQQNAWAFFPGFPMVVRLFYQPLGLDPVWTGIGINQLLVAASVLVLVDISRRLGLAERSGMIALALFMLPAAPVFWMFYSEALFVFLTLVVLDLLVAGHHWTALLIVPAASLTRSTGVALAAAVLVVAMTSAWQSRRSGRRTRCGAFLLASTAVLTFSILVWPVTAARVTGRADALVVTYDAWRAGPSLGLDWLPFFHGTNEFIAVIAVMVASAVIWQGRAALGRTVMTHAVLYVAFLVVVGEPTSSTVRYLMPLVALPLALGSRGLSALLIAMAVVAKFWWVFVLVVQGAPGEPPP